MPLDDRGLAAAPSGAWTRNDPATAPDARYFERTYSRSTRAGAKLTRSGIQATHVAIVVTSCPSCGTVRILWNGSAIKTVDLASSTVRRKRVIPVLTFGSLQVWTLELRQASGGKLVEVDGVAAGKA